MRNINSGDPWQILFYRSLSFIFCMSIFLVQQNKKGTYLKIKNIGYTGIAGAFFLMTAQIFYVHAFALTSIGNTLFTLSSIPFITAFLAFIFLREKIGSKKIIIMLLGLFGIIIMASDNLDSNSFLGSILALLCAISFSLYTLVMRRYRLNDMYPTQLVSGIFLGIVTLILNYNALLIPVKDMLLCFLWGGILSSFANIIFIYATKYLNASEVTFFILLEFALGPFWVWIFLNETITKNTFYGGMIVMLSVCVNRSIELYKSKIKFDEMKI